MGNDRDRAEAAARLFQITARAREEFLERALDRLPGGVYVVTRGGALVYLSAGIERVTGYEPAEIVAQQPWRDRLIAPGDAARVVAAMDAGFAQGSCDVTYQLVAKDGSRRTVRDRVSKGGGDEAAELWYGFLELLEPHAKPASLPEAAPARLAGKTILVVDDDPDTLSAISAAVRSAGAQVITATSGREALTAFERQRPHLIVADVGMPEMDGYELIRHVRELPPDRGAQVPALALTGFAGHKDRSLAMRAGFDVHLAKPVSVEELLDVLEDLAQWAAARHAVS